LPREWLLENPLSQVSREEQRTVAVTSECGQESQCRNADILRLVDHNEVVRRMTPFRNGRPNPVKHRSARQLAAIAQRDPDSLEHGPQHGTLAFRQSCLSAQAPHITV